MRRGRTLSEMNTTADLMLAPPYRDPEDPAERPRDRKEPMSTPLTQRVDVGAYYTDGAELWEVVHVAQVGAIDLRSSADGRERSVGIDAFRRGFWLARSPLVTDHGDL